MSRNGAGTYSLPAGNPVVTGTTISSTWANTTLSDIATALTTSIASDGQTVPSASLPMGGFRHTGVDNANARTTYTSGADVQDSTPVYLTSVSGTNTITATAPLSMSAYVAGQKFHFVSAGANTGATTININSIAAKSITKNGTTALISGDIPSGAAVEIIYDGTQFQMVGVVANLATDSLVVHLAGSEAITGVKTFSGGTGAIVMSTSSINEAKGADIASAGTTDIGAATGNYIDVTGTVTITALGTVQAGVERTVRFTGALILTYNATSLILPGAANITTAAGDVGIFRSLGSGNWRCVSFTKANGRPISNGIVQVGPISPTSVNTTYTIAHSLGSRPKLLGVVARCTNSDGGWTAGDDVPLAPLDAGTGRFTPYVDATNCGFVAGGMAMSFRNKGTPSADYAVNWSNWDVYFYVTL